MKQKRQQLSFFLGQQYRSFFSQTLITDTFILTRSYAHHCLLFVVATQVDRFLIAWIVLLEFLNTAVSQ